MRFGRLLLAPIKPIPDLVIVRFSEYEPAAILTDAVISPEIAVKTVIALPIVCQGLYIEPLPLVSLPDVADT